MKPLIIYHDSCTDGFGAAFAAWLKLGDEAEYLPMHYIRQWTDTEKLYPEDIKDREVYILDFSFPHGIMDDIFDNAKRVVWLDHQKTAFEMWIGEYFKGIHYGELDPSDGSGNVIELNDNKSGALLAWEYFHPDTEVPMLIQHIDDRDRWVWKMEGSAEIHAALGSYKPWSFRQWQSELGLLNPQYLGELKLEGAAILRAQKQHVEQMAKQARKCEIKYTTQEQTPTVQFPWRGGQVEIKSALLKNHEFTGLAVNTPLHQSEVGHELANTSGTFGLVWYVAADKRVRCSLRSNGEYDVSSIARAFGGGGHRNAAGFETDVETLMGWLK